MLLNQKKVGFFFSRVATYSNDEQLYNFLLPNLAARLYMTFKGRFACESHIFYPAYTPSQQVNFESAPRSLQTYLCP